MRKNLSGFTLIEIIVVIVIIGVIAGAGLPKFFGTFERTKSAEAKQILLSVLNAQKVYYLENTSYATPTIASLDITIPESSNFGEPTGANNATASSYAASIERKNDGYILKISESGAFTCDDGASITCAQAGL